LNRLYLERNEKLLSQVNYKFVTAICDLLGIETKLVWSSNIGWLKGKPNG